MSKITYLCLINFLIVLLQGKLVCPLNCEVCTDSGACISCFRPYILNEKGSCRANCDGISCSDNIRQCKKTGTNGTCIQCSKEAVLFKNRCIYLDKYCSQADQNGNCMRCTQGLAPFGSKCVFYENFCASFGNDRMCNQAYGWFETNSNVSASAKQEYRIFVLSANQAQSLKPNITQTKVKNLENSRGYYSEDGVIQFYPSLSTITKSIKSVKKDFTIVECKPEYIVSSGLCIKQDLIIQNCQQYSPISSECIMCESGYDMNSTAKCQVRSQKSCIQIQKQKKNCLKCNGVNGYYNVGGWCVSKQIVRNRDALHFQVAQARIMWPLSPNCDQQRSILGCEVCLNGFVNRGGKCVQYQKDCLSYHPLGFCQQCSPGFNFEGGNCVSINCLQKAGQKCQSCAKGYEYQGGKCFPQKIPHCAIYSGTTCIFCQPQNYFNQNSKKCEPSLPNCAVMNGTSQQCIYCNEQYTLYRQHCMVEVPYCVDYSLDGKCLKCDSSNLAAIYQVVSNGTCLRLPSRCKKLNQAGVCQQCEDGYTIIKGFCLTKYCSSFNNLQVCTICESGYMLNPVAMLCQTENKFCVETDANKSCIKCLQGYAFNIKNNCVKQIKGCKSYGASECYTCMRGLQYIQGNCRAMNCATLKQDQTVCQKCKPGYQLTSEGLCKTKNCELFSEEGWACNACYGRFGFYKGMCQTRGCTVFSVIDQITCLLCEDNYELIDGACLHKNCATPKDVNCRTCIEGWIPDFKKTCVTRECLTSDIVSGVCLSCNEGKRLSKGICVRDRCVARLSNSECHLCETSFYLANQRQYCVAYFCKDWDQANGQCLQCAQNFYLSSGRCISKLCSKFDNSSQFMPICASCPQDYYPFSQYCVPNKCQKEGFNPMNSSCEICIFGFEPDKGICKLSNCQKYKQNVTDFSQCKTCRVGFSNQAGYCLASNCQQFESSSTKCIRCNYGFYLFSDICLAYNCQIFDDEGKCQICFPNFKLQQNLTCTRLNCLQDTVEGCLRCQDGYVVNEYTKGFCYPVNCQEVADQNQCRQCYEGFNKDYGICKDMHCDQFSSFYECQKCRMGYAFSSKGICELVYPSFCPYGQFYNQKKQSCDKISIAGCKHAEYNEPNICIQCMDGYFLKGGLCFSVNGCSKHSYLTGCSECEKGLKLMGNRCLKQEDLCQSWDGRKCTACKDGFILDDKQSCAIRPEAVLSQPLPESKINPVVKPQRLEPVQKPTISITQPIAKTIDQAPSAKPEPQLPQQGYKQYRKNCLFEDDMKQVCIICNSDFYITDKGLCLPIPIGCKFVNMRGQCFYCQDGFTMVKNTCVQEGTFKGGQNLRVNK